MEAILSRPQWATIQHLFKEYGYRPEKTHQSPNGAHSTSTAHVAKGGVDISWHRYFVWEY